MVVVNATAWSLYPQERDSADCVWNVMAHAQKTDFVFRRNGRVHLNQQGLQFSQLLAAEVCASTVVMLDTPSSKGVRRVLVTHSIHQFPLRFPSRASPCVITFQLDSTTCKRGWAEQTTGLTGAEYLTTTDIRSQDRPARSEWLYRVSHPGPVTFVWHDA
jgi:hypothetical protein